MAARSHGTSTDRSRMPRAQERRLHTARCPQVDLHTDTPPPSEPGSSAGRQPGSKAAGRVQPVSANTCLSTLVCFGVRGRAARMEECLVGRVAGSALFGHRVSCRLCTAVRRARPRSSAPSAKCRTAPSRGSSTRASWTPFSSGRRRHLLLPRRPAMWDPLRQGGARHLGRFVRRVAIRSFQASQALRLLEERRR